MRKLLALGFLAFVGCASGVTREDYDAMKKRVDELERDMNSKNGKMTTLYEAIVDKQENLGKRVSEIEAIAKILDTSVKRIEDRLKKGVENPDSGTGSRTDEPKTPDAATRTSEALLLLKTARSTVDDTVATLKPIAKDAAPLLCDELRRSYADPRYSNQLVAILSNLPPEAVRTPVTATLQETGIARIYAARIIGNLKDLETSKALEVYADTKDEDFRLVLGESMVNCRNAAGVPLLVASLKSTVFSNRVIAVDILRRLTKGDDFGFRPSKPELNDDAVKKWEEWAQGEGKKIFD